MAAKAREIQSSIGGLYDEIALAVAAAVLEDRLPLAELERAIGRTLGLAARGQLAHGKACYFRAAMRTQFRQRGISWPEKPEKGGRRP